jgi:hypothetical protein
MMGRFTVKKEIFTARTAVVMGPAEYVDAFLRTELLEQMQEGKECQNKTIDRWPC